jgi:hypothetical protein
VGNSRIHEFICDYVEGRLDSDLVLSFEKLMESNPILRAFVDASVRGKSNVQRVSEIRFQSVSEKIPLAGKPSKWKRRPSIKLSAESGIVILILLSALLALGCARFL